MIWLPSFRKWFGYWCVCFFGFFLRAIWSRAKKNIKWLPFFFFFFFSGSDLVTGWSELLIPQVIWLLKGFLCIFFFFAQVIGYQVKKKTQPIGNQITSQTNAQMIWLPRSELSIPQVIWLPIYIYIYIYFFFFLGGGRKWFGYWVVFRKWFGYRVKKKKRGNQIGIGSLLHSVTKSFAQKKKKKKSVAKSLAELVTIHSVTKSLA